MWPLKKVYYRSYQQVMKVAMYCMPWKEPFLLTGPGSIKKLPNLINEKGISSILIVTDPGLMKLNLLDDLFEELRISGVRYALYDQVQPNPTIDNIEEARKIYVDNKCQGIIAFGGGSPMDCAKIAGARVARPTRSVEKMRGTLKVIIPAVKMGSLLPPPLFAVPTTAGTGSETTLAAVISNPVTHEKYPINDPCIRPRYAVLDPELTVGLPPHITSTTGIDALTHAVEAYIGKSNTSDTALKAKMATKMIYENVERAYKDGSDIEARGQMLLASYYAGVAFTRAYVGYIHSIAHNLGGMYNIPHGLANAIIMPYVLEWYGKSAHKRLAELADSAGIGSPVQTDEQKANAFIESIKTLNRNMNIPNKIEGIKEEDIPTIAERALKEANPLYPVPKIMNKEECMSLIKSLMA